MYIYAYSTAIMARGQKGHNAKHKYHSSFELNRSEGLGNFPGETPHVQPWIYYHSVNSMRCIEWVTWMGSWQNADESVLFWKEGFYKGSLQGVIESQLTVQINWNVINSPDTSMQHRVCYLLNGDGGHNCAYIWGVAIQVLCRMPEIRHWAIRCICNYYSRMQRSYNYL